jgi:hypothetical protein
MPTLLRAKKQLNSRLFYKELWIHSVISDVVPDKEFPPKEHFLEKKTSSWGKAFDEARTIELEGAMEHHRLIFRTRADQQIDQRRSMEKKSAIVE